MSSKSRIRCWMYTLYLKKGSKTPPEMKWNEEVVRYVVNQLEKCPKTGRLHVQGYIELNVGVSLGRVKCIIGGDPHCEPRKGTQLQAINYCSKESTRVDGPWVFGVAAANGERNGFTGATNMVVSGSTMKEVAEQYPGEFVRYHRGLRALSQIGTGDGVRPKDLVVEVYYGDTGTGKTHKAYMENPGLYSLQNSPTGAWFDGYEKQLVLLIDDYYGWIPYQMLLQVLHRWNFQGAVKGSFITAAWTKVIITSNVHPRNWYKKGLTPALARRIGTITYFQQGQEPVAERVEPPLLNFQVFERNAAVIAEHKAAMEAKLVRPDAPTAIISDVNEENGVRQLSIKIPTGGNHSPGLTLPETRKLKLRRTRTHLVSVPDIFPSMETSRRMLLGTKNNPITLLSDSEQEEEEQEEKENLLFEDNELYNLGRISE